MEQVRSQLADLSPGSMVAITNTQHWTVADNGPRRLTVEQISEEIPPKQTVSTSCKRIYTVGPEGGCYVLMPQPPAEMRVSPEPRVYHRIEQSDGTYVEDSKGRITSVTIL